MKIYSTFSYTTVKVSGRVSTLYLDRDALILHSRSPNCRRICWGTFVTHRNRNFDHQVNFSCSSNRCRNSERLRMPTLPRKGSYNRYRTNSAAISRLSWHLRLHSLAIASSWQKDTNYFYQVENVTGVAIVSFCVSLFIVLLGVLYYMRISRAQYARLRGESDGTNALSEASFDLLV